MAMTSLDDEPLSNTLRPLTDATITVRVIKSFEYRTLRGLVLQHVDLTSLTVGELKDRVRKDIQTASGFKPYRSCAGELDTLKIYTKAHGHKTMDLVINLEDEDWVMSDESATLSSYGIEHESEISFFQHAAYLKYKENPHNTW